MNDQSAHMRPVLPESSVLAQISDPIIVLDFDGRVLFWNREAKRLYRQTSEQIVGAHLPPLRIA